MKDHTTDSWLSTVFFPQMIDRANNVATKVSQPNEIPLIRLQLHCKQVLYYI